MIFLLLFIVMLNDLYINNHNDEFSLYIVVSSQNLS
jgi:hypothetical protein